MGKQTKFYMNETKEKEFVEYILSLGGTFITQRDFQIFYDNDYAKIKNKNGYIFSFIHNGNFGEIKINKSINIHNKEFFWFSVTDSAAIEFSNSAISLEEKAVSQGRIYVEMSYYENGEKVKKSQELDDFYKKLVKWIKKNIPYQEISIGGYTRKEYITDDIVELINAGKITHLQ